MALIAGLLVVGAGCGSDNDAGDGDLEETDPAPEVSAPAESAYVAAVNARCAELEEAVLPITGGGAPTLEEFRADQPKLARLITDFDKDIATIPVPESERATARAFAAFRKLSDDTYDDLVAAAETGDAARFRKAFGVFLEAFNSSDADENLEATGILCPAR